MPAFLIGAVLSWPIDYLFRGLPEWVSLVPALWYLIGFAIDRNEFHTTKRLPRYVMWMFLILHSIVPLVGALLPLQSLWLYTGFIPFGVVLWVVVGTGIAALGRPRKKLRGVAGSPSQ